MSRSITVTTPIPTLEQFGESLGLSKARLRSLAPIFIERRADGGFAVRRHGSGRASVVAATQREAIVRARELNPSSQVLVERVRETTTGNRDKWRRA